jgi:hypothetical protein
MLRHRVEHPSSGNNVIDLVEVLSEVAGGAATQPVSTPPEI